MSTTDGLISRYYDWLKAKTNWREINDWVEITTPYLDRHNDCIQIYLKRQDGEWVLTDDGYTLADLAQSGGEIDTPRRKALLATAVNGLFYVARANVESFFFEDVALWLDDADVRYTLRVNFVGRSHYNHQFDFVVPKSKRAPERILRVINNPNKDTAQSTAFAWLDTKEVRPSDSQAFAILNDRDRQIGDAVPDALRSYDIVPIAWSKREEFRERLAA